jgi:predicted RNA-binding protein
VQQVSKSNNHTCWILKCDIRKFFASIDQLALIEVMKRHITDPDIIWLVEKVVESFESTGHGKGLPLGNPTSQLLVNVYMNEFDQFVKHVVKQKYYIRYADDFVFVHKEKIVLIDLLQKVRDFLSEQLKLSLHPNKIFLKTVSSGVDFLSWVHFPTHRVLRTTTKRRMFARVAKDARPEVVASYRGMLSHGNAKKLASFLLTVVQSS